MKRVLIGGIGNILYGDDGIGPRVIQELERRYAFADGVELVDFGTPGLSFLGYIAGCDVLLLVDAADNHLAPGTITVYTREDILRHGAPMRVDPHSPSLAEALLAAEMAECSPSTVKLIGVTGEAYVTQVGLTEAGEKTVEPTIQTVLDLLAIEGVTYEARSAVAAD